MPYLSLGRNNENYYNTNLFQHVLIITTTILLYGYQPPLELPVGLDLFIVWQDYIFVREN